MALVESPRARRDQYINSSMDASSRRNARSRSRSPQVSAGTARALAGVPRTSSKDSINAEQQRASPPAPTPGGGPVEPLASPSEAAPALPPVRTRQDSPELLSAFAQQQQPFSEDSEDAQHAAASGSGHKRAHSESPVHRRQQQRMGAAGLPAQAAAAAAAGATAGARQSPFVNSAFANASLQLPGLAHGSQGFDGAAGVAGTAGTAAGGFALPPLKVPHEQQLQHQMLTEADIQQAVSLKGWLPDVASTPSVGSSPVDRQVSLQHWARADGSLSSSGSFSLQQVAQGPLRSNSSTRLGRNDLLQLDIRVLSPVLPEQYPEGALEEHEQMLLDQQRRREEQQEEEEMIERQEQEAEAEEAAQQAAMAAAAESRQQQEHQQRHHQQQQHQQQWQHAPEQEPGSSNSTPIALPGRPLMRPQLGKSRLSMSSGGVAEADEGAGSSGASEQAFFAKIAAWEQELVGMLQAHDTPVSIRAIIATFKDRILTERDKIEFKGLCDKWTSVVEWPAGTKCLQMKSWMRGAYL